MRSRRSGGVQTVLCMAAAAAVMFAAACGERSPDARAVSAPEGGPAKGAFPVTIEHKYGSTQITEEPNRVLSLGFQEHDAIFALGVTPIAVRYWFGGKTDVIFPWADDEAAGARPEILEMPYDNLNFEKIASLRPDLILGIYSGMTDRDYETLAKIAPTVAQTGDYVDYGVPWQDMTRTVGRALGRAERADKLVTDLEARFDGVRSQNPAFAGKTVAVATYSGAGQDPGFFASEDPRSRFFTSLGFKVPAALDQIAGDKFFGTVSAERL